MTFETTVGIPLDGQLLGNYLQYLVGLFFKILPLKENEEETLGTYLKSLQMELMGLDGLVTALHEDARFLSLLAILQYLRDDPDCAVAEVKREVFRAISICNKLQKQYGQGVTP
jgi:hypothetical protein